MQEAVPKEPAALATYERTVADEALRSCGRGLHDYTPHPVGLPKYILQPGPSAKVESSILTISPVIFCRRCGNNLVLGRGATALEGSPK